LCKVRFAPITHFGSHIKYQNHHHKARFTAQNITKLLLRPGLCPGPHSAPTDPLAVFKKFASQQRRKGRVDRAGRKGRIEEEKNGETREGRERNRPVARSVR